MKKIISLAIIATLAFYAIGCDDDEEETSKAQLATALCDRLAVCDETGLYAAAGGADGCEATAASGILGEADCPDAEYDPIEATECKEGGLALSCDEFISSVEYLMGFPDAVSTLPDACDIMCGAEW